MVLTLSNPDQANALAKAMFSPAIEALNAAADNPEIRAVVIVGEGHRFSAGLAHAQGPTVSEAFELMEGFHSWIEELRIFPKPVIAGVEGATAGAAFALALACDLVVAASDATFTVRAPGLERSPLGGLAWLLARALPRQTVCEMLMTERVVQASQLHAWGLASRVCEPGHALESALLLASEVSRHPDLQLARLKEDLNTFEQTTGPGLREHLASERARLARTTPVPTLSAR